MVATRTRLGAIDAGSNAIRVVIAELVGTELVRIEAERIPVRLGHNAFTQGTLEEATIDAAVAAFVHFRERFDHHQVGIYRAITTSADRRASLSARTSHIAAAVPAMVATMAANSATTVL